MTFIIYLFLSTILMLIISSITWTIYFAFTARFFESLKVHLLCSYILVIAVIISFNYTLYNTFITEPYTMEVIVSTVIPFIVFVTLQKVTIFKTLPGSIQEKVVPENTHYITLQSGSKIAYWIYKTNSKNKKTPILFIHGGPGAHTRNIDREFFSQFSNEGHDVLCFDQPGGGFSDYLPISEYSMDRIVEDIELLRKHMGYDKLILVGQSFGARISAYYTSKHVHNVEKIIFAGPAGLIPASIKDEKVNKQEQKRLGIEYAINKETTFHPKVQNVVRFGIAIIASKFGGSNIASQLISQEEITDYSTRMIPDAIGKSFHKKYADQVPKISSGGINVLMNVAMINDYKKVHREMIHILKEMNLPVLVLRSSYDYVSWKDTSSYRDIFKNTYLVHIKESGHVAWTINKVDTYQSIKHFINEEYDKIEVYTGNDNPYKER